MSVRVLRAFLNWGHALAVWEAPPATSRDCVEPGPWAASPVCSGEVPSVSLLGWGLREPWARAFCLQRPWGAHWARSRSAPFSYSSAFRVQDSERRILVFLPCASELSSAHTQKQRAQRGAAPRTMGAPCWGGWFNPCKARAPAPERGPRSACRLALQEVCRLSRHTCPETLSC